MKKLQSSLGCLILLISVASATGCFITNCPPGGKRATGPATMQRRCAACGPHGRGHCYGPSICCSVHFGCFVGSPETLACRLENRLTTPCQNPGSPCSGNRNLGGLVNAQCAGPGICCDFQSCTMDESCLERTSPWGESSDVSINRGILPPVSLTLTGRRAMSRPTFQDQDTTDHLVLSALINTLRDQGGRNDRGGGHMKDNNFFEPPAVSFPNETNDSN